MAFVDRQNLVSDAQAVTTTAVSTDKIALGATGLDIAAGEPMGFVFQIDVAAAAGGTESYSFQVVTATASDLTTGQVIIAEREYSTAQALADLVAGKTFTIPIPLGQIPSTATHIGVKYETANSAAVTVTAFLQPLSGVQSSRAPFRSGFTVAS
jgi:hypothetical protein